MQFLSFGLRLILGLAAVLTLVVMLFSPVFGTILLSFLAIGLIVLAIVRKVWRFSAPERALFSRVLVNSVDQGPVSGGLVPMFAWLMLMALIVIATFGGV